MRSVKLWLSLKFGSIWSTMSWEKGIKPTFINKSWFNVNISARGWPNWTKLEIYPWFYTLHITSSINWPSISTREAIRGCPGLLSCVLVYHHAPVLHTWAPKATTRPSSLLNVAPSLNFCPKSKFWAQIGNRASAVVTDMYFVLLEHDDKPGRLIINQDTLLWLPWWI